MPRVVGLDLSLTGAGIARIATTNEGWVADVREHGTKPAGKVPADRAARLRALTQPIIGWCAGADLVAIEEPAYSQTTGQQHDRSGAWWLVVSRLIGLGIPVAEVPNNYVKQYSLQKGGGKNTGKDFVLAATIRRYPTVNIRTNNEADSFILAAMAARHLGHPIEDSIPAGSLKAMGAVAWPM